ncbi:hypothetical protein V2J09_014005, partial [Rumex salicifolius]
RQRERGRTENKTKQNKGWQVPALYRQSLDQFRAIDCVELEGAFASSRCSFARERGNGGGNLDFKDDSRMLKGRSDALPELKSQQDFLLNENMSEEFVEDEEVDSSGQLLYIASCDELAGSYLKYDTIIWVSISLLLVLAWGAGVIMLLYLPFKRYVLQKDISSRKLCVTPTEIVYKVTRPSFIPFWREANIDRRVPLSLVIDIIIEQGWLQSIYGLHTIRIESISCGKAAPVDVLQIQGVSNPGILRKYLKCMMRYNKNAIKSYDFINPAHESCVLAAKVVQDSGSTLKLAPGSMARLVSFSGGPVALRSPSMNLKVPASPRPTSMVSGDVLLYKLEEVNKSVKEDLQKLIVVE